MKNETYQILATLYRLLGDFDYASILSTSKQKSLSKNIRLALTALAKEAQLAEQERARAQPSKDRRLPSSANKHHKRKSRSETLSLFPGLPPEAYKRNLLEFLLNKANFSSKVELAKFASHIGFTGKFPPKDSQERVARRIVSYALKHAEFREALHEMVPNGWSSQTQGWMKLILGSK